MPTWYQGQNWAGRKVFPQPVVLAGGYASQPPSVTTPGTVAAGTVSFVNTTGYDVMIYMSTSTSLGTITVNGVVLPGTAAPGQMVDLYVPSGQSFGFTFTGNLTWAWLAV